MSNRQHSKRQIKTIRDSCSGCLSGEVAYRNPDNRDAQQLVWALCTSSVNLDTLPLKVCDIRGGTRALALLVECDQSFYVIPQF